MCCRIYQRLVLALLVLALTGCGQTASSGSDTSVLRLGYFPNLTHAAAIVGVAQQTFQDALGAQVRLEPRIFNAGPSLIEALFAGELDIGYVGPNPAINGYLRSKGEALRIIAGASSGGARLMVRPEAGISQPADLAGRRLATPQIGNTQDVALRAYLREHGLAPADSGGNVQITPTQNADILTLFKQGQIDGAWVPEPWASRLAIEAQAQTLVDERTLWPDGRFVSTTVVVRKQFLDQHPDLVAAFLGAHIDTVIFINENQETAKSLINSEIARLSGAALPREVLDQAFDQLEIDYDPLPAALRQAGESAFALGFLDSADLDGIYDLAPLNTALSSRQLSPVDTGEAP